MAKTDRKGLMEVLYRMIGRIWICATTTSVQIVEKKRERDQAFCVWGHVIIVSTALYLRQTQDYRDLMVYYVQQPQQLIIYTIRRIRDLITIIIINPDLDCRLLRTPTHRLTSAAPRIRTLIIQSMRS